MRKLNMVLIVIFSLIALMIVAVLVGSIFFQNTASIGIIGGADGPTAILSSNTAGDKTLLVDTTVAADGIEQIDLTISSDSVNIYESTDDQFRVVQYGRNLSHNRQIIVNKSGSSLSIKRPISNNFQTFTFGYNQQSWVELYIPASYRKNLNIRLSSGDLHINHNLTLGDFHVQLSSGYVKANNMIKADNVSIQLTSGSINMASVDSKLFDIIMSSGNVTVDQLSGSGRAEMTSGSMRLNNVSIDDYFHTKVTSGMASITLSDDPSLQFQGNTTSGEIKTYFELYYEGEHKRKSFATVGNDPYKQLTAQVTSGTVRILNSGVNNKDSVSGKSSPDQWDDSDPDDFENDFD